MFQRTLLRQAQAARSILATSSSTSAAPLALRRTSQFQTRLPAAVRPFAPQPFARSYSTENKEAEATENAEAEDPVKKQLEAKEKEVVELKVFTSINKLSFPVPSMRYSVANIFFALG